MTRVPNRKIACIGLSVCYAMLLLLSQDGGQAQAQSPRDQARMRALPEEDDESRPPEGACFLGLCAREEREIAATLVRSGPDRGSCREVAKPSVVGLVRNGWPVVIDFEPEPGTFTVFRVKLYHRRWSLPYYEIAFQQVLDPDGTGGRRTVVIPALELTGQAGAGVRVARYDVRSFRLANGELVRAHHRLVTAPVTVYGMGAGPHAVGSMTVLDVHFLGPATIRVPARNSRQDVRFSYRLTRDYDAVAGVPRFCNPRCSDVLPRIGPLPRFRGAPQTGLWTVTHRARVGNYGMDVRAWLQCGGASAVQALASCADDAAWTFATAPALRLTL